MATNEPTPARRAPLLAVALYYITYALIIGIISVTLFMAWPGLVARFQEVIGSVPTQPTATAPAGNVGGQAPANVRGTNPDPAPRAPAAATPIPGIAQNEAESLSIYQTTIAAPQPAQPAPVPTAVPAPLPLNSAGAPIIDAQQQQQLDQSAQMAADEQQAALLADQIADAQSRAPDVSKEDAEQMMHRDLCSVPRANPHTCEQGLYKPTPIGAP